MQIPFRHSFCMNVLLAVVPLILFPSSAFEVNPMGLSSHFQTTKTFCIQNLQTNSSSSAFFQNRLTRIMHKTENGNVTIPVNMIPMAKYKKMECIGRQKVSLLNSNNKISLYDSVSQSITSFEGTQVTDMTYVKASQNQQKIVYISNLSYVHVKRIPFDLPEEIHKMNGTFSNIICSLHKNLSFDGYCFLLSQDRTKISFFNVSFPSQVQQKQMPKFTVVKISETNERIYIGYQSGSIKQYSIKQGLLFFERSTKISQDSPIIDLAINEVRNQLIYLNGQFKTGIISLQTGFEVGSTFACKSICTNASEIVLFAPNQFSFFTFTQFQTIRPFLNNQAIIDQSSVSSSNPLKAQCLTDQLYFNSSSQKCIQCQPGCSLCDEETAFCFSCLEGYFMKDQECFSCKFSGLDEESYHLCFEEDEISVLSLSNAVSPVLVSGIQSTYSILSGSALLFLFIRFINFWSLVSMYYFLNIETMPYFLLQFLSKIFTILYGSVFEYFGIDLSQFTMKIQERETNEKMKLTKITTDFVAANFQSIATFIYSTILICVLYDAIKKWFLRFSIHLFEKVKLEACLQEFMAIFIPLVVPLSYFLMNLTATNTLNRVNNGLFIAFLGIGAIFPFIYITLIVQRVTLKQRLAMIKEQIHQNLITSKKLIDQPFSSPSLPNQAHKAQQIQDQATKIYTNPPKQKPPRRRAFRIKQTAGLDIANLSEKPLELVTQQEGEKFFYCVNAFWSPFLVGFASPVYFLFFGVFINFISVVNAFYASHWRANLILEKFILFAYHLTFVLMAMFPDITFTLSLIAIGLIIFGGIHELLTAVAQKIYFVYLVLKNKKILRDNKIAQQKLSKSQKNILSIFELTQKYEKAEEAQNQSENSCSIQGPTLKQIIDSRTVPNLGAKTIIKKTKFITGNHPVIFDTSKKVQSAFCFDNLTSIQSINIENKNTQVLKDHKKVVFEDVINTKKTIKSESQNSGSMVKKEKKSQNLEVLKKVEKSSMNHFEESQEIENKLSVLKRRVSSMNSKEKSEAQNKFQTKPSENVVSKSVVHLKDKKTKQSRFLKVLSTKLIQKKKDQNASVKNFQKN